MVIFDLAVNISYIETQGSPDQDCWEPKFYPQISETIKTKEIIAVIHIGKKFPFLSKITSNIDLPWS